MKSEKSSSPTHVAIIMDGNGRWANQRGLARIEGHRSARTAIRDSIRGSKEAGVRYLSLFAFSSENWKRPASEIYPLFSIFTDFLIEETPSLHEENVQIHYCGCLDKFPNRLQKEFHTACNLTKNNTGLYLNVCMDFSGKEDILHSVRQIVQDELRVEQITEQAIEERLISKEVPPIDLLIRTSGEQRISNFMLWHIAYAELYFDPTFFPDFRKENLLKAIESYKNRDRRFGSIHS
ncbi:MAG TPA: polyprenyl diphosphate synthase [Caldisericia bacterium]|nr:polyprenyl diphosphate synthase [Caldisericia bacterium]HXK51060.1 polyprenyl diphosphate synthase [Caldisericia bacterium]